ncbi:insulinase family protein, partial [Pyxidicoccus sp. 3LG]
APHPRAPGATQGQVHLACRLPAATPESEARYALMAELLGGESQYELRSRRGATYGFYASPWLGRGGAAHLLVQAVVDAPRMAEGLGSVQKSLAAFAKQVSQEALDDARTRLLARQGVSFLTSEDWVDALLEARVRGFQPDAVARRPAHLQAVTADALRQEFAGCLERLVVGVTGDERQVRPALQALSQP